MSAQLGRVGSPHAASSHGGARVNHVAHVLEHYGVLTRARLYELCGAGAWRGGPAAFDAVVGEAIHLGRMRALGSELLETPPGGF